MVNINISYLDATDPLPTRYDVPGSNAFAELTESSDRNRMRVIMSSLTVSIPTTSNVVLTCENVHCTKLEHNILFLLQVSTYPGYPGLSPDIIVGRNLVS